VRRFLHEIVLAEESDLDADGNVASHFELYRRAMRSFGADTGAIDAVVDAVHSGVDVDEAVARAGAPVAARSFVAATFAQLRSGGPHSWAAAFTFGREDVIPAMFRRFVDELASDAPDALDDLVWYLDRHINLDGEEHAPLALQMVCALCGDNDERWAEASDAAHESLRARVAFWDGIVAALPTATPRPLKPGTAIQSVA
jgi:pyrroloquinoline quinone (PQQ) biosynthesis protein C